MVGSYILHNDLHYNGLMTDWGLRIKARDAKKAKENEHRMTYPSYSVHKETTSPQLALS